VVAAAHAFVRGSAVHAVGLRIHLNPLFQAVVVFIVVFAAFNAAFYAGIGIVFHNILQQIYSNIVMNPSLILLNIRFIYSKIQKIVRND
jgi:hypothetical protein